MAPISSMSHMMPVATTSLADQVLDLSFKPQSRLPSEKKVKPIKRLSKKALQSVFHPYVDQADLMRMAAPLMPPPPAPAASVSPSDSRRGKKVAQHNSFMQAPPKPTSPFVFQIEEYHVGVAPNGTKVGRKTIIISMVLDFYVFYGLLLEYLAVFFSNFSKYVLYIC